MNFKDIPLIVLGEISPISTNMIAPNTPHSKYSKLAKSVVNDTNFLPQKSWSSFAASVCFPSAKNKRMKLSIQLGINSGSGYTPSNSLEQPADEVAWSTGEILLVNYQSSRMYKGIYIYLCIIFKVMIDGVYIYLYIYMYRYINV